MPATTTQAGRAVRGPRGGLRPAARPVGARDEPRRRDRRRLQLAAEAHRPERRALPADPAREAGSGGQVPDRQRLQGADVGAQPGHPAPHRTGRRARSHRGEPDARAELAPEQRRASLRLVEQEALDGAAAYAPLDFLADVRRGVWSEIYDGGAARRSTPTAATCSARTSKRSSNRINGAQAQSDDARAFFRGELKTLDARSGHGASDARPIARRSLHIAGRADADRAGARSDGAGRPGGGAIDDRSRPTIRSSTSRRHRCLLAGLRRDAARETARKEGIRESRRASRQQRKAGCCSRHFCGRTLTSCANSRSEALRLSQRERQLDLDEHGNVLAEALARAEAPAAHRLDRLPGRDRRSDRASGRLHLADAAVLA